MVTIETVDLYIRTYGFTAIGSLLAVTNLTTFFILVKDKHIR